MTLYDGPIVDAHHHLWDLNLGRHPWLSAYAQAKGGLGDVRSLRRNYLPADYRRDAARQRIIATVHVEAGWSEADPGGELHWLDGLDKAGNIGCRYVAHVSLGEAGARGRIEAAAGHERVVAVRDTVSWHPDPARSFARRGGLMEEPGWRRDLRHLGALGLGFDLMLFPHQLAAAARLAAAFPNQQFALNHAGSPTDRDAEGMRRWREGLRLLAGEANVAIKLSSLVTYDRGWTLASLRPVIRHCLDCFGPDRTMLASDFPVAGLHASFD